MPIIKFNKNQLPFVIKTIDEFLKVTIKNNDEVIFINMTCPHRGGPLSHGEVLNKNVVCPWHKRTTEICKLKKINLAYVDNGGEVLVHLPSFEKIVKIFTI